ncbi:MAG: hypothetical protein IT233_05975 [Bacteroidia bacterium]|nr:hypothetical protein [Bacteroidia bacterium]
MTISEIFFTVLVIWILFRIFRKDTSSSRPNTFTFHTHHHPPRENKEGETRIHSSEPKKTKDVREGEYIDYEEIKD